MSNNNDCETYKVVQIKEYAKQNNISLKGLTRKKQFCERIINVSKDKVDNQPKDVNANFQSDCMKRKYVDLEKDLRARRIKGKLTRKAQFCQALEALFNQPKHVKKDEDKSKDEKKIEKDSPKYFNPSEYEQVSKTVFSGIPKYELLALIYLLKKHQDSCAFSPDIISKYNKYENYSAAWYCNGMTNNGKPEVFIPLHLIDQIKQCKKRFFFIPITLRSCNESGGHANGLLYDSKNKTIERFDPHGESSEKFKTHILDQTLTNHFGKLNITYIPPNELCPIGPQKIQTKKNKDSMIITDPLGFCSAWMTWYIDMRLTYPDLSAQNLLNKMTEVMQSTDFDLTTYIRNYSMHIIKGEKYLLLQNDYKQLSELNKIKYLLLNFNELVSDPDIKF